MPLNVIQFKVRGSYSEPGAYMLNEQSRTPWRSYLHSMRIPLLVAWNDSSLEMLFNPLCEIKVTGSRIDKELIV